MGLIKNLGLAKNDGKGVWGEGRKMVDHLGLRWESVRGSFTVLRRKQEQVRARAKKLVLEACGARKGIGRKSLRSFVGVLTALLPWCRWR